MIDSFLPCLSALGNSRALLYSNSLVGYFWFECVKLQPKEMKTQRRQENICILVCFTVLVVPLISSYQVCGICREKGRLSTNWRVRQSHVGFFVKSKLSMVENLCSHSKKILGSHFHYSSTEVVIPKKKYKSCKSKWLVLMFSREYIPKGILIT
jgi:hypothetical protein